MGYRFCADAKFKAGGSETGLYMILIPAPVNDEPSIPLFYLGGLIGVIDTF